jgi:hypothetical protein
MLERTASAATKLKCKMRGMVLLFGSQPVNIHVREEPKVVSVKFDAALSLRSFSGRARQVAIQAARQPPQVLRAIESEIFA